MDGLQLLVLRITDDCNLRCKYCYARSGERNNLMSRKVAFRAIDYAAQQSDSFKVQFTGGEPLLGIDLIEEIVDYGQQKGLLIDFQLQTNGMLIDERMAGRLKSLKIAMGLSLDGWPEINDQLRIDSQGSGSAKGVITGLHHLGQLGIKVGITATLTKYNLSGIVKFVDLLSYLGNVAGVNFDLYRPIGRGSDLDLQITDFKMLQREVKKALDRAVEIGSIGGIPIQFKELEKIKYLIQTGQSRERYCYAITGTSFAVMPEGEVYPCSSLTGYQEFSYGNILDAEFDPSSKMQAFISQVDLMEDLRCQNCQNRDLCGGGCIARAYSCYGKLNRVYLGECILRQTYIDYARNLNIGG